jgi:membrane protein insertase Oxa1/YidC/SpoIIIJ
MTMLYNQCVVYMWLYSPTFAPVRSHVFSGLSFVLYAVTGPRVAGHSIYTVIIILRMILYPHYNGITFSR